MFRAKRRFLRAHIGQRDQKRQSQMGYERHSRTGATMNRIGSNGNGNNEKAHKYALTENITPPAHAICLLKEKSFTVKYTKFQKECLEWNRMSNVAIMGYTGYYGK